MQYRSQDEKWRQIFQQKDDEINLLKVNLHCMQEQINRMERKMVADVQIMDGMVKHK